MEGSEGTSWASTSGRGAIGSQPWDTMKLLCVSISESKRRKTNAWISWDCSQAKAALSGSKITRFERFTISSLRLCRRSLTRWVEQGVNRVGVSPLSLRLEVSLNPFSLFQWSATDWEWERRASFQAAS